MKKTILLLTILVSIAIFSGTFSGNASAGIKAADDCCQTFITQDLRGRPLDGCTISVWNDNGFYDECITSNGQGCQICNLDPKINYFYSISGCGDCSFSGSVTITCGVIEPMIFVCQ